MPDPLKKDDFQFPLVDDELEESRGKVMAYRAPQEDPIRRRARISGTDMGLDLVSPDRQLPEGGKIRLNRAAERIGGVVGRAVFHARRVPHSARERLHLVRDRAQHAKDTVADRILNSASSLADAAQERVHALATTAQEQARDFTDKVEERGRAALDEVDRLSIKARLRAEQMRRRGELMINEHPLEILGFIAGAALIAGISLRIVRAHNARRY